VEDEKHKTLVRVHGGCNTLWRLRASVRAGGATPIERIRRRRTLGWGPAADTEDGPREPGVTEDGRRESGRWRSPERRAAGAPWGGGGVDDLQA